VSPIQRESNVVGEFVQRGVFFEVSFQFQTLASFGSNVPDVVGYVLCDSVFDFAKTQWSSAIFDVP
jgi:hypothetical protein